MADLNISSSPISRLPAGVKAPVRTEPAREASGLGGDSLVLSKPQSLMPEAPPYTAGSKVRHGVLGTLSGLAVGGGVGLGALALTSALGGAFPVALALGFGLLGAVAGGVVGYLRGKPKPGESLLTQDPEGDKAAVDALYEQLNAAPNQVSRQRAIDRALAVADSPGRAAALAGALSYSGLDYTKALEKGLDLCTSATQTLAVADFAHKLETDGGVAARFRPGDDFYARAYAKATEQTKSAEEALAVATQALKIRGGVGAVPALKKGLPAVTDFEQAMALAPPYVPSGTYPEQSAAHLVLARALELAKTPDQRKEVAERAKKVGDLKLAAEA